MQTYANIVFNLNNYTNKQALNESENCRLIQSEVVSDIDIRSRYNCTIFCLILINVEQERIPIRCNIREDTYIVHSCATFKHFVYRYILVLDRERSKRHGNFVILRNAFEKDMQI